MSLEHQASLGAAAVMDAVNLKPGSQLLLDGELLVVDRVDGEKVFIRVATFEEKVKYFLKEHWIKLVLIIGVILIGVKYFFR